MRSERLGSTTWFALLIGAGGCGDGGGSHPLPDAAATGHDLTVSLFRHLPFVDGDTDGSPLVAVQDGNGPWTAVAPSGGVYRAHLAADRHGVAIGCPATPGSSVVEVFQRAAADGFELRALSCAAPTIELDVAVRNVPGGSFSYVATAGQFASGGGDTTYVFHTLPGVADLFASQTDSSGRITKLVRVPAFDLEAPHTATIDFAGAGAAPEDRSLAVMLAAGEQAQVVTSVIRPSGEYRLSSGAAIGAPAMYQMLPAALRQPDDLFEVAVTAGARSARITSKAPDTLAFELPSDLAAPAPTMILAPSLHPAFSFEASAAALAVQSYQLHARTSRAPDDAFRDWTVELSAAWIAGAASVRYEFPDLSALPGFSPGFVLFNGPVRWSVRRTDTSAAAAADGRVTRSASQAGTVAMYCGDDVIQPPETCDPPDGVTCSATCAKL